MVQLTCSCLNIRIHVQEKAESLVPGVPNLTPDESKHPFFSKGACVANLSLGGISEGQSFLVRNIRVGSWKVSECLNCHLLTHACHVNNNTVAVSTVLINDANKIQMLQRCEGYSPAFCMVFPTSLDNRPLPPLSPTDFSVERSSRTEAALKSIQQQVGNFLKKAEAQVESNIQAHTDQQQAALSVLQSRTRRDRQTIMRLLANVQTALDLEAEEDPISSLEMESARGLQFDDSPIMREKFEDELLEEDELDEAREEPDTALPPLVSIQNRVSQPMGMNPLQGITGGMRGMRLSSSVSVPRAKPQGNVRVAQSLDAEGLFDMDGMMDSNVMSPQATYHSDEDDTDDSNHDEGIHIPGGRVPVRDLAQSVPVSIPMWPSTRPKVPTEREPINIERPADTDQMAESIKALARSVYSTSVDLFGDLPRPTKRPF